MRSMDKTAPRRSLDDIEREKYKPYSLPMDTPYEEVALTRGAAVSHCPPPPVQSLDGDWQLAEGGYTQDRTDLSRPWADALTVRVPNSIHTNLYMAGRIPDPLFGKNDKLARENSYKIWWYKKTFRRDEAVRNPTLRFDGVCYRARFWLNGRYLGEHGGMFGGPDLDISGILEEENTLIVKIEDAPSNPYAYSEYADFDEGWKNGVVVNCVYGWHYACIPSRGIWRPVHIDTTPRTAIQKPFAATINAREGIVDLLLFSRGAAAKGTVAVTVSPKNFEGDAYSFEKAFEKPAGDKILHYRMKIENPRLWWPLGHGEQNLYRLAVTFRPEGDIPSHYETGFGIRTVEMGPLPGGPREDTLNFTYILNGKPIFVKGTNWCTTDALLRFPDERLDRFLTLLKTQNVQLLRAWGGGMPESDEFYDRCDELGIMVRQEWPTCWDSDRLQPESELAETVARNLERIRNHPSLVTLAGGNESDKAESPAMTRMARLCYELDGTRTFYKTSPYGGAIHSYITYWERQDIDASLRLKAPFIGEFGMASAPNLQSVQRYLPDEEKTLWPPAEKGSFYYHMPRFNECRGAIDIDFIGKRIPEFDKGDTMQGWINASQLAQATVIRHLLESMRSRWPESVGICYYKATDVYPACSWATVDYYGVPKLSYYVVQDAYEPLHAALILESIDARAPLEAPVFLFDDGEEAAGREVMVRVRAFDSGLDMARTREYTMKGETGFSTRLGGFPIDGKLLESSPLFLTTEVFVDGERRGGTFYWLNFKDASGCLFDRPRTALFYTAAEDGYIIVENAGDKPAVGVTVECYGEDTVFETEDSVFWLNAGESVRLRVNRTEGLTIKAWNAPEAIRR